VQSHIEKRRPNPRYPELVLGGPICKQRLGVGDAYTKTGLPTCPVCEFLDSQKRRRKLLASTRL
jgi:hypothetical protein